MLLIIIFIYHNMSSCRDSIKSDKNHDISDKTNKFMMFMKSKTQQVICPLY